MRITIGLIVVIILSFSVFPLKVRSAASAKSAICLPTPVKIVYPPEVKAHERHPHQYSTEKYEGELTIEIGDSKRFDLKGKSGLRIDGIDAKKSHTVRYRHNGIVLQALKVKFEDPNFDLVIDQ